MKPRKGTNDKVRPVMKHKNKKKEEKKKGFDAYDAGWGAYANWIKRGQDESS